VSTPTKGVLPKVCGLYSLRWKSLQEPRDIDDRGLDWRTRLFCYEVNREGEGVVKLGYERI
jgi:hypothetical protein